MEVDSSWLLLQDLNFSLSDINSLSTVQLCLVQFHPEADDVAKSKAELAYWRRRNKAQARAKTEGKASQPIDTVTINQPLAGDSVSASTNVRQDSPAQPVGISAQVANEPDQAIPLKSEITQQDTASSKGRVSPENPASVPSNTPPREKDPLPENAQSGLKDLVISAPPEGETRQNTGSGNVNSVEEIGTTTSKPNTFASSNADISAKPKEANALLIGSEESLLSLDAGAKEGGNQESQSEAVKSVPSPVPNVQPSNRESLSERLDDLGESQGKQEIKENDDSQMGKRKRNASPGEHSASGEPPFNRAKTHQSTYDRFANQRLPPPPVIREQNRDNARDLVKKDNNTDKQESHQPGSEGGKEDGPLPLACLQELACVFVGNIPHTAKDGDIRAWLIACRTLPRPAILTKLATARSNTNGYQFLRLFFLNQIEAEKAVGMLRKTPFEAPPAQLLIRPLKQDPARLKFYWRDVLRWARPYLQELASKPTSSASKEIKAVSREHSQQVATPPHLRERSRDDNASARHASPLPTPVPQEADNLADRLGDRVASYDRHAADNRQSSSGGQLHASTGREKPQGHERTEDFTRRRREPEMSNRLAHGRPSRPDDDRHSSNADLFRRFDASPPRRRRDYTPPREPRRDYPQEDRSNLLGRLR